MIKNYVRPLSQCLLLLCLLLTGIAHAQTTQVRALRISRHPPKWRLVFDVKGPLQYRLFSLNNPARIVIDIKNAVAARDLSRVRLSDTPVRAMRIGRQGGTGLRLVLDLYKSVKLKSFTLPKTATKPTRLVLDLKRKRMPVSAFDWPFKINITPLSKKTPEKKEARVKLKKIQTQPVEPVAVETTEPKRSKKIIIVIDPGHGGHDPGAIGAGGTREKTVVLKIARELRRVINHQPGFRAVLTRRANYYLPLRRRLAIARKYKADMFVSVHADAFRNRTASGAAVYALSRRGATSEAARWLAKKENESELMGGVHLTDKTHLLKSVLLNLSQTATIRASLQIGQHMIHVLKRITRLHHNRVEQAAFVVLKSPDIPSLLVETGFLSNPHEELKLLSRNYRRKLAAAIMRGIKSYFIAQPPRGTWLAKQKQHRQEIKTRYVVAHGDTLSMIAERFHVRMTKIQEFNRLHDYRIRAGQVLLIPKKG